MKKYFFKNDYHLLFSFGVLSLLLFGTEFYLATLPILILFLLLYKRGKLILKLKKTLQSTLFYLLGGGVLWVLAMLVSIT